MSCAMHTPVVSDEQKKTKSHRSAGKKRFTRDPEQKIYTERESNPPRVLDSVGYMKTGRRSCYRYTISVLQMLGLQVVTLYTVHS